MTDFYCRQKRFILLNPPNLIFVCDMTTREYWEKEVQVSVLIKKAASRRQWFTDEWWVNTFVCRDDADSLPKVYETDQMKAKAAHRCVGLRSLHVLGCCNSAKWWVNKSTHCWFAWCIFDKTFSSQANRSFYLQTTSWEQPTSKPSYY